jgi:hypothetical protein
MKILIAGDSFSADWSKKYPACLGWPNILSDDYQITNLSQAGCSEYKIYLQLTSVDLLSYDAVIVSHTSPYRWYVKEHPVHAKDQLHSASDLIYNDVAAHMATMPELEPIVVFFEKYFDLDYAKFVHNLICAKIETLIPSSVRAMHIQNFDSAGMHQFKTYMDFYPTFRSHPGLINHYSKHGNKIIAERLTHWLASQG